MLFYHKNSPVKILKGSFLLPTRNSRAINNKKKDVVDTLYELTNLEIELRNEKAFYGCVRTAGFPFLKTFEDFDFSFQPTINREQIIDFKNLRFIENKENIIFVGSPGVGKTHLATAIGITAAQNRNSTYFINYNDLIANLKKSNSENRFINRINHYAKYKVLVIDEVGFLPVDPEGANMLFQLINKRYERHSTIITTNKPFGKWHEIFNDVTLANAILDRLLHHSHIININGNSYRLKNKIKIDSESTEPIQIWLQKSYIFIFNFFYIFILTLTIIPNERKKLLQLADYCCSALFQALKYNNDIHFDYIKRIQHKLYSKGNNILSYGLKLVPNGSNSIELKNLLKFLFK